MQILIFFFPINLKSSRWLDFLLQLSPLLLHPQIFAKTKQQKNTHFLLARDLHVNEWKCIFDEALSCPITIITIKYS